VLKRFFDIVISFVAICIFFLPLLFLAVLIKLTSKGPIFYWSDRVGRNNKIFRMPKFRTMHINTPVVATHLLKNPELYLTSFGKFLRKTSLDEFPQLYNIIKGDMSFVGPRPALFNQDDLVALRTEKGVHVLTPGLTGWAQIMGRDELTIEEKVNCDEYYLNNKSFLLDIKIILQTIFNVLGMKGISH